MTATRRKEFVEVRIVRFDDCKSCRKVVELLRLRVDHRKAYRRFVEVRIVRFDDRKTCRSVVEVGEYVLATTKRVLA